MTTIDASVTGVAATANRPPVRRPPANAVVCDDTSVRLSFTVSRDEEHVDLRAAVSGWEGHLGERVHHYPLLLLVRQRMHDQKRGVAADSAGWVDFPELARMLGIDTAHLRIQMFRLRRQCSAVFSLAQHHLALVEHRRGQIRAASMSVCISQGGTVQREYL